MRKSTSRLLHCLSFAGSGLATAALLLLGTATPARAAFPIIDDFNAGNDDNWTQYSLPNDPANNYYGQSTFTFPTNPAGPANFAYRIQVPILTNDPDSLAFARGGAFREDSYVSPDNAGGRFLVGIDLVAWNNNWDSSYFGLGWWGYVDPNSYTNFRAYVAGWGPGEKTMGIAVVDSTKIAQGGYGIAGATPSHSTVLDPTHQYREVASSHDGVTFMIQLFDLVQPTNVWQSAIATDYTFFDLGEKGGYSGVLLVNTDLPSTNQTQGADVTFDNYYADVPADGAMPAVVTDLSPQPGGRATVWYPTVQVGIFNRDTSIDTTYTPLFYMDGVLIQPSNPNLTNDLSWVYKPGNASSTIAADPVMQFPGATISYNITNFLQPNTLHTNKIVWKDSAGTVFSNVWSWTTLTAPSLYASNSLPVGSLSLRGFDGRTVVSTDAFDNTIANAVSVLNYPVTNPSKVALAATNIVQLVAWDIANGTPATFRWGAVTNFPGLCLPETAHPNYYAVQTLAYLQLSTGPHRFHVDSDDAVAIYSGTNLLDTSRALLSSDAVTHADIDFVAPADGLYPFNIIMEEGNGDAYLCLYSVNLINGVQSLINTNNGDVKAFYPLVVKSSTSVKAGSTWTVVTSTNVPTTVASSPCGTLSGVSRTVTGGTSTIANSGAPKYYRLEGPRSTRITGLVPSGSNVGIVYQAP